MEGSELPQIVFVIAFGLLLFSVVPFVAFIPFIALILGVAGLIVFTLLLLILILSLPSIGDQALM